MNKDALTRAAATAARLAGLLLALAFHAAWLTQPLGWRLASFHLLLTALAIARPAAAVVVVAGLMPLTTSLNALLHSPFAGWTLLLAMLWAAATGVLRARHPRVALRTRVPALLLAITAVSSALVGLAGDPVVITTYPDLRSLAAPLRSGQFFVWVRPWVSVHYAVLTALALLLVVFIERTIRDHPVTARWLVGALLAGHALASAISLGRFAAAAARSPEGTASLLQLVWQVRFHSQYDVNAAASALVIVVLAGTGLALSSRGIWERAIGWSGVGLALAGLWLAGSRAALAALMVILVTRPLVRAVARPGRRAVLGALGTVAAVTAVAAALYAFYPAERNVGFGPAFETRKIMTRTAINAGSSAPIFGIGIGRFHERAYEFGASEMLRYTGPAGARENAHNQFLQVFAELGLIGLVGLALLTVNSLRGALRDDDRLRTWTAWGVAATLGTWLLGHPLLVPESAVVFWMALGVVAGLGPAPSARRPARFVTVVAAALVVVVVIATPLRAWIAPRRAHLEHLGVGVSPYWIHDEGVTYRAAADRFSLFLPSSTSVVVPLRVSDRRYGSAQVDVILRGRLINRVQLPETGWLHLRMLIPASDSSFERVDFVVTIPGHAPGTEDELVHVGRTGITPTTTR